MKICYALNCDKEVEVETIIHHHSKKGKCNPYDSTQHCYFELCKHHYKEMHKIGDDKLVLKAKYYE